MPTNRERREVAARLRNNAGQKPSWVIPWAVFNDAYEHECDELHARLADLIEPEERTCRNLGAYGGFECSICGFKERQLSEMECEPHDWFFCPNCGAKVVEE